MSTAPAPTRRSGQPRALPAPKQLKASAQRVTGASRPKNLRSALGRRQEWQTDAWTYFDTTPEAKAGINRQANQISKLTLIVATADPEDPKAPPIAIDDERSPIPEMWRAEAQRILDEFAAPIGGQSEILRTHCVNFDVAGECFAVGIPSEDGHGLEWDILSVVELIIEDLGNDPATGEPRFKYMRRSRPGDRQGQELPAGSEVIRMWTRSSSWSTIADSNFSALLLVCETLAACSQLQASDAYSRMNAGALTVPNEMSFGSDDGTDDDGADQDDDPFLDELDAAITEPIDDPRSPTAHTPTLIRGPAEYLQDKYLRHLTFERTALEKLDARIEGLVLRLARGLNMTVESTTGLAQTTFANAAQLAQDEWERYLQPRAVAQVECYSYGYLRPDLIAAGCPPEIADEIFVWFDKSDLEPDPDPKANAQQAYDALAISDAAYRGALGFTDDDAPEPFEIILRMAGKGLLPPEYLLPLLEYLDNRITPEAVPMAQALQQALAALGPTDALAELTAGPGTSANVTAAERLLAVVGRMAAARETTAREVATPPAIAGAARPVVNPGAQLMSIDRELRTRLTVAGDQAMGRALDKAGNRLRTHVQGGSRQAAADLRARIPQGTLGRHIPQILGRAVVASASAEDLFADAWAELEEQFRTWGASSQAQALAVAGELSSGLTDETRRALTLRQADDLDTAWAWMRNALASVAEARLFDPDPTLPPVGEFDPTAKVPTGLVRRAMSIAGGRNDLAVDVTGNVLDAGAWVALDPTGRPQGGIGTGTLVGEAVEAAGGAMEGYRWVYGLAYRAQPFHPHMGLDGTEFVNFDDAALANGSGWPAADHYFPGDHAGCICDFEPIIIDSGQAATS